MDIEQARLLTMKRAPRGLRRQQRRAAVPVIKVSPGFA
jgi:hypothetical protein